MSVAQMVQTTRKGVVVNRALQSRFILFGELRHNFFVYKKVMIAAFSGVK